MSERKIELPFPPEFGLEDLSGRANLRGPYRVVSATPTLVVVATTVTFGENARELYEKLTPHDLHHQVRANWRAAAEQLGLTL